MVNHYHFHIIDRQWGHITIRISDHPPFGAQILLNGHEWVECQAREQSVRWVKEGNCFVEGSDLVGLGRLAEGLGGVGGLARLAQVCERWIYSACLCFGLSRQEQERSQFRYAFSAYQLEYSRNLLFKSGRIMDEIYQSLIDRTRGLLDVPRLKTIFETAGRTCLAFLLRLIRDPQAPAERLIIRPELIRRESTEKIVSPQNMSPGF